MTSKDEELNWMQEIITYSFVGLITLVILGLIITALVLAFKGPLIYKYIFWGLAAFIIAITGLYWIGRLIIKIRDEM